MLTLLLGGLLTMTGAQAEPAGWVAPSVTEVGPGVWRVRFATPETFTPERFREAPCDLDGLAELPAPTPLPFAPGTLRCRVTPSRTVVYVPCHEPTDEIYGFGLDPACYAQKGLRKRLTVAASKIGQTGASHGPVPFYVSTKGYGVYVDTARVPFVHVARLAHKAAALETAARQRRIETDVAQLYAAQKVGGKPEVVFDLPGNPSGVDVFLFAGPSMREAVQRYNLWSGGGCMPPLWGLGMKYRTYTRADQASALRHAKGLRHWHIPADMFGLEPGWQTRAYSCSFVWSEERFPDHEALIAELDALGLRLNLWEHAYIHPESPMFPDLAARSGDYLVWNGLVVDFADPEAFAIFADYHEEHLVDLGVAGFKADECDRQPITDCTPFNYPYCTAFPSGIDGDQMTQLYGYFYQRAIQSVFRKKNRRTWGDVRATTALAAPLPFNLYSDAYAFDEYLRQLLNASFTGLLWSPEVREAGSFEEFANRLALSSFAPQMCMNPWFIPNPLWEQYDRIKNERNELLPPDEQARVAGTIRRIAEFRMRLLPYLYACFWRYRTEGLPPVRSALLDFPEDRRLRTLDDQFFFGDNLLVAPYCGADASRTVYFPRGADWIDFSTKRRHHGGTEVQIQGEPGQTPLFVKENTLLPLAEPVEHVAADTVFDLTVEVYGDAPAPFTLIEDDGESFDYEQGHYTAATLSWREGQGRVDREGAFPRKRCRIRAWRPVAIEPAS